MAFLRRAVSNSQASLFEKHHSMIPLDYGRVHHVMYVDRNDMYICKYI